MSYTITTHSTPNQTTTQRVPIVWEGQSRPNPPAAITIHHWGDPADHRAPTAFDGVRNWLMGQGGNSNSSAHEVIEAGRVAVLAPATSATWHSGDPRGNARNYALELHPRASDADYDTAAQRIADLWDSWGREVPLDRHQDYTATACPGAWDINRLTRLARSKRSGSGSGNAGGSGGNTGGGSALNTASYRVRRGDTLGEIAQRARTSVQALQFLNGISNPNRINVNQTLWLRWVVARGQSLSWIAGQYNRSGLTTRSTSAAALANLNGISNPNHITPGQRIRLP